MLTVYLILRFVLWLVVAIALAVPSAWMLIRVRLSLHRRLIKQRDEERLRQGEASRIETKRIADEASRAAEESQRREAERAREAERIAAFRAQQAQIEAQERAKADWARTPKHR